MRLDGKVIIIIGASDERSMGAATARRLAAEGAKLVLGARRLDQLKPIADSIRAEAVACDISKEEDVERIAETALSKFGRIDGAVSFAGVNSAAPITEVTREVLQEACDVHLIGSALFIKHMANRMTGGGSIVITTSQTAYLAPAGLAAYAGTKRGADQIMRIAALELGPKGIRVNSLSPGFTRSGMTEGYFAIPTLEAAFLKEIPLKRLPTVEDMANTALWLLSDESRATTGQVIDVSCGQTLRRVPDAEEMMGS